MPLHHRCTCWSAIFVCVLINKTLELAVKIDTGLLIFDIIGGWGTDSLKKGYPNNKSYTSPKIY